MSAGNVAPREIQSQRQLDSRKLQRFDDEIIYAKSEIEILERRRRELDTITRFKHSYGFSLDQDQIRLALLRAQLNLSELERNRSDFLRSLRND